MDKQIAKTADTLQERTRELAQVAKRALKADGCFTPVILIYSLTGGIMTGLPDMQDTELAFCTVAATAQKYGATALITVVATDNCIFACANSKNDPPFAVLATYARDKQGDVSFEGDDVELKGEIPAELLKLVGAGALLHLLAAAPAIN